MKALLRTHEAALILGISKRQVQRYLRTGELCGTIVGRERFITREQITAFMQKREALAAQPNLDETVEVPKPVGLGQVDPMAPNRHQVVPVPAPEPSPRNSGDIPAHCRPAVVGGPITNVPHPCSGSMPSPEVLREHYENEARKLVESFRGTSNVETHEYEHDFTI